MNHMVLLGIVVILGLVVSYFVLNEDHGQYVSTSWMKDYHLGRKDDLVVKAEPYHYDTERVVDFWRLSQRANGNPKVVLMKRGKR